MRSCEAWVWVGGGVGEVAYASDCADPVLFDDNAFLSLASLSAACCPDIDEVYTDTCARLLACGSEESELERLGYATRCEGAPPFWMGLDASGMV